MTARRARRGPNQMRTRSVLVSLLLAAACSRGEKGPGAPPPPVVTAAPAQQQPLPVVVEAIGAVEAVSVVEVKAQVQGQLAQILFREGDKVEAGAPLFELDRRPFELALRTAQANLTRAREQALLAAREAKRARVLERQQAAATEQVQQRETALAAAQADVRVAQAAVEQAALNLEWTRIVAPVTGRTGALQAHVGDLVKANADTPLVTIRQLSPAEVRFTVPGTELPRIRERLAAGPVEVEARVQGEAAPPALGRLTFVDNAIDEASGTIALKATFPNEDERLWPGAFIQVAMRLGEIPDAIVVPQAALQRGQEGDYVFVVGAGGRVEQRPVQVGERTGDLVQIARGVRPGEAVVTEGQLRLASGAVAQVRQAPPQQQAQGDGSAPEQMQGNGSPPAGQRPGEPPQQLPGQPARAAPAPGTGSP